MSWGTLTVPKSLLQGQPTGEITQLDRAVAWEIASLLDERRVGVPAREESEMLVLDVPAERLRGPLGRDDNANLHAALKRLARIQWADQEPDGRRFVVQLIGEAEISTTGTDVRLWLPPRAVRFLRTPSQFARLDRETAHKLPPNAQALYGLLKDRFAQPDQLKSHEATYTLDEIKGHLQIGGRYPRYADFRKWVLEPSIDAINKAGVLSVDWEPVKTGRRVTAIKFTLRIKDPQEAEQVEQAAQQHSDARGKPGVQPPTDAEPLAPGNKPGDAEGDQLDIDECARARAWWDSLPMDRRAPLTRSYDPRGELARDDLIMRVWQAEGQPKPEGG